MNRIIAIVGMCGSGKSVVVDYFLSKNFKKVYFGGITYEKMEEEGIPINKENERKMQKKLREQYGMAAYATLSIPKIKACLEEGNVVIDGLYSWDELRVLQEAFSDITVVAITADKSIRYERLSKREDRPHTREEAKKRDIFEIENTAKGGPIAYADYFVLNNGSIDDLNKRLEEIDKEMILKLGKKA